ncbi:MAG: aminoacyl-tRNA deacylase [Acidobacteriota bacterium]
MPDDQALTPVGRALAEQGIPLREFSHPGPILSLEQAAEERGQRPEQVVRSILFRLAQDDYLMVLVAGPRQIDWKVLRHYLGQSRLTMASADEVRQVTGYEIGAVSPFALPRSIRILLDEGVLRVDEVSIGSGVRNTTVIMSTVDLLRALGDVERVAVVPV